jgi:hypothetical protein
METMAFEDTDQAWRARGVSGPARFPTAREIVSCYDGADLNRAVQTYRFFYPTVSGLSNWKGNVKVGVVPNRVFGVLDTKPRHVGFTLNSDTPYACALLDLTVGPLLVEVPAGPLIGLAIDLNQGWLADMGLSGPDAGKTGQHLFLPPDHAGPVPAGPHVVISPTYRVILGVRALPIGGDLAGALARLRSVKVRPLLPSIEWSEPRWIDLTSRPQDTTPLACEDNLDYWRMLQEAIDSEPVQDQHRFHYGELAALGIMKGRPFVPDVRQEHILEQAAAIGSAQMRVQSFADRRPDRVVWNDRQWEWAALRFENGGFLADGHVDLEARDKWFYQAIGASPAMFRRQPGAGSVYWLSNRDANGRYLDGGQSYVLDVPLPVPSTLFWSVTVYDAETRSQINTHQGRAALRSLFELRDLAGRSAELHFGPEPPAGHDARWIETIPGRGWFTYFRVYGPDRTAFNGAWKPGDIHSLT